jgi:general secretion pathway protein A
MYLMHFGLKRKPFDISPDPDFLWLGEKHREGLAILKYGILENKGFLLITGEVGTGKTALIRSIEREIDAHAIVVTIPDPGMSLMDFYNFLAFELKMERGFNNKGEFLVRFKRLLIEAFSAYKRVLLIIDESQRLDHNLLEEIRLLSNIDLGGKVLINIFFVGQSEFRALLAKEENRSVRQRITVSYHIAPLSQAETHQYIQHRLSVAGATREIITPDAGKIVYHYSRGFPRLINIICDHALMSGYSLGAETVGPSIIKECAEELRVTIGLDAPQDKPAAAPGQSRPTRPGGAAATPVQPQRRRRSAWVFAVCLLLFALGWYTWQDSISEQLARWGKVTERGAPGRSAGGPIGEKAPRVPPLAVEPAAREEKPEAPATVAAETQAESASSESAGHASPPPSKGPDPISAGAATAAAGPAPAAPVPAAAAAAKPAMPPQTAVPQTAVPQTAAKESDIFIFFTQNSSEIPIYALEVLSQAVALLKEHPRAEGRIEGHSDALGNPSLNMVISEARANSVKNHLVRNGIPAARLTTSFYGSDRPIDSNDNAEGRSKNRRVVIRIKAPPQP